MILKKPNLVLFLLIRPAKSGSLMNQFGEPNIVEDPSLQEICSLQRHRPEKVIQLPVMIDRENEFRTLHPNCVSH
jgi:hypothetical protein